MKTFPLLASSLTIACALASCGYDNRPYGYTPAGYSSPGYVTTYRAAAVPSYYGSGYSGYNASTYSYRSSYPGTYTSNRHLAPGYTQTYVSGYPQDRHMSVGGYGYVPPAPRPAPWPLR
ncbi:MAG: hypothetical protein ACKVY0_12995 [Prosthecobacter sp.]|uniref:hypothetical protein n=1 Tax=Prosthecobacter sp. TaxID=1965333 RepID=UPI0038FE48D5